MSMLKSEEYQTEIKEVSGFKVCITSYKIGDTHFCKIDNVDPGATISRSEARTREEALNIALSKASRRLTKTK
jgi:hypothetical protein